MDSKPIRGFDIAIVGSEELAVAASDRFHPGDLDSGLVAISMSKIISVIFLAIYKWISILKDIKKIAISGQK